MVVAEASCRDTEKCTKSRALLKRRRGLQERRKQAVIKGGKKEIVRLRNIKIKM
jgi:hypothetical protein